MKRLVTALALITTTGTICALPNYDPFANATASGGTAYAEGNWLSKSDAGTVGTGQKDASGGQWYHAGNAANSSPTIVAGSLQYPGLAPASTNRVQVGNNTAADLAAARYVYTGTKLALGNGQPPGSRFYSFVLKASDISGMGTTGGTGAWIAGFNNTAASSSAVPSVLGGRTILKAVDSNTGFQIGLCKGADTPTFGATPQTYTTSDQIFIVVEYVMNNASTSDDIVNMWINPNMGTFADNSKKPAATLSTGSGGVDLANGASASSLQSFVLGTKASTGLHYVDEVRVASDWAGVTPSLITNQPASLIKDYGDTAVFSVGATGGPTYQWRKNDAELGGETASSLTLTGVSQTSEGSYTVVVTVDSSSITSAVATLTVNDPKITSGPTPASQSLPPGDTATFSTTVIGSPTLAYQWRKDGAALVDGTYGGTVISGASSATLTITGIRAGGLGDAGTYTLCVTNGNGRGLISSTATLAVIDPALTTQPVSQSKNYGESVTFSVAVAGSTPPFSYIWRKNGSPITVDGVRIVQNDSGTTSSLTIHNLTLADEASAPGYTVAVTDNASQTTISSTATLTVTDPIIVTPVASVITNLGASAASLKVIAAGSGTLTYVWKTNGVAVANGATGSGSTISGADTDTLTISGVTASDAKSYVVEVSGAGLTQSSTGSLSVVQITRQPTPSSLTIGTGGKAVFSAVASVTGTGTLTYQWRKTGGDVAAQTTTAMAIVNAQPSDSDSYYLRVSYGPGSAYIDSTPAALTVSVSQLQLAAGNLVVARVGDGAQTLRDAGNSIYLDQFSNAGTYVNTVTIPDSGTDALIARGTAGANIGGLSGMTTLTTSGDGNYLVLNGYRTNYDATSTIVLGGGSTPELDIPRAVATVSASSQYVVRIEALGGLGGANMAASAYRCAAFDGVDEYWGTTGSGTVPVYYYGTQSSAGAITIGNGNCRVVNLFNGKFYACLANEGLYRFDGKPHPGDSLTLDLSYVTTGGSGNCDFSVSPDGNTIYIADGRPWQTMTPPMNLQTNGGIQVYTNNGFGGYPIARVLKPDPDSTVGALYVTVDYSQASPAVYATTIGASQNKLVKIVDDGSNSGTGTATVIATAGVNQQFRGVRFSPTGAAPAKTSVHIDSIINNGNGTITINYSGGSGASFTLMKSTNLNLARDSWTTVGSNNASTPGSFTITPAGNEFYSVRSN